jgi:hypothetical protein
MGENVTFVTKWMVYQFRYWNQEKDVSSPYLPKLPHPWRSSSARVHVLALNKTSWICGEYSGRPISGKTLTIQYNLRLESVRFAPKATSSFAVQQIRKTVAVKTRNISVTAAMTVVTAVPRIAILALPPRARAAHFVHVRKIVPRWIARPPRRLRRWRCYGNNRRVRQLCNLNFPTYDFVEVF